ncbi:MAG: glycosyltransferase family 2 protein [Thermoanaerobaculia bacterium]
MSFTNTGILAGYYFVLVGLAFYGSHRFRLVLRHYRGRAADPVAPPFAAAHPAVLVQLPIYNERFVVERLLEACAVMRWAGPLRIQLLDDSQDDTPSLAAPIVARLSRPGVEVMHVRRGSRAGFKAGALAEGMRLDAEHPEGAAPCIAIFDADFVPPVDFLEKTVAHLNAPGVGLVQARWDHLNREESLLTRLQAIFLDGHFVLESAVRYRGGLFFNFNGTAGVWKREAIEQAGGWSGDTLTEDLDLSYRALLKGWRFVFLAEVTAPAEVPARMNDFKSQQARWTKGSIEVGRRILPALLRAKLPARVKLEAFIHLTNNLSYVFVVLLALLIVPSLEVRREIGWLRLLWLDVPLFLTSSLSVGLFYLVSQRELGRDWRRDVRLFPMMMSLGIGMAVGNAIGVVEALVGSATPFFRTPKRGGAILGDRARRALYRTRWRPAALAESALTIYFALAILGCVLEKAWVSIPFLVIFFTGFLYGSVFSVLPAPRLPASAPRAPAR